MFKRKHVTFDQGSAMLYGFGEKGFNAHRFVFNCLEEPIDMIRHDLLYRVNFQGKKINFWPDVDKFASELATIFPNEKDSIKRFYHDMLTMYQHVMVDNPTYPSVVLYTVVDREVIPEDTAPIEMLVGNPDKLDESEVTAYILSIDDRSLCGADEQTVTTSGLTAANVLLEKLGKEPFVYREGMKNYVNLVEKPFTKDRLYANYDAKEKALMQQAMRCRFCEHPSCTNGNSTDIRGIMRRTAVGNFKGANKRWLEMPTNASMLEQFENSCIYKMEDGESVRIREIIAGLEELNHA